MTKIIATLRDDALATFAGQTISGTALEAHTSFRYMAERGRKQTFQSYMNTLDALEAAGVTIEQPEHLGDRAFAFPA